MSTFKVKAKKMFSDAVGKKTRTVNEVFTVDQERLDALNKASSPLVEVLEEIEGELNSNHSDDELNSEVVKNEDIKVTDQSEKDTKEESSSEQKGEHNQPEEVDELEKVKETDEKNDYPLHVGGPYYLLSNGEQVKGKDAAFKAEKEL